MGFKTVVKGSLTSGVNLKRWVGIDGIKSNAQLVGRLITGVFERDEARKIKEKKSFENFEECVQHYGLTESTLKARMKKMLQVVYFCLALAAALIAYTVYLFHEGRLLGGFDTSLLTLVLLAQAFREHFNYFQMKQRRLGCTFKEWFASTFGGVKS